MSMVVAAIVFVALLAVALAHFIWSLGGTWPIRDRALLPKAVIGRPGVTRVPRLASFVIAVLLLAAGIIALALADRSGGGILLTAAGAVLAMAFIARGVLGYTIGWRAAFPEEPFATLDRRNYSPLCLVLGTGFLLLVLMRLL